MFQWLRRRRTWLEKIKSFTFQFDVPNKEVLRARGKGADIRLMFTFGILNVFLPPEEEWADIAPETVRTSWRLLHDELAAWCNYNGVGLVVTAPEQSGIEFRT